MKSNTAYSEEFYTYKEIRLLENRAKETRKQKVIQKTIGILFLALTVTEFIAANKGMIDEGGLFLITLPLGLYLLLTQKKVLTV